MIQDKVFDEERELKALLGFEQKETTISTPQEHHISSTCLMELTRSNSINS